MSFNLHGIGGTDLPANTTLNTFSRIKRVGILFLTTHRTAGAIGTTLAAADTFIRIDPQLKQPLASPCRTPFVFDMFFILFSEVANGCQDGVGGSSTQGTQGGIDDSRTHILQNFDVTFLPTTFGNIREDLQHPSRSFTAGCTFAA